MASRLDALGHRQQAMHHRLRPLLPDRERCGFIGHTLREVFDRYGVL